MEIRSIDEKAYAQMKRAFEKFRQDIEELCPGSDLGKEWLDNEDVCFLLNINKRTLQHYRDYGTIPFTRIGNKCYYKPSDVERILENAKIK